MKDEELIENISDAITRLRYKGNVYIDTIQVPYSLYAKCLKMQLKFREGIYTDVDPLAPVKILINNAEVIPDRYVAENRLFCLENGEIVAVFNY